jgi:lipopolysaccharide transport system permease protein
VFPLNRNLDLIYVLARTQLKARYKKAALGYLWSLAHPLAFAMVLYFVFQVVMPSQRDKMAVFLLSGLFPWQWISNSVVQGTMVFISNGALIRKVAFPRYFLPLSMVLQDGWHFLSSLPVLLLILYLSDVPLRPQLLVGIPLMMMVQASILLGIALLLGSLNMFLRDIEHLVEICMMMGFYATPIIYDTAQVPGAYGWLIALNPFTSIIGGWRSLLLDGVIPWSQMESGAVMGCLCLGIGSLVYRALSKRFAELL